MNRSLTRQEKDWLIRGLKHSQTKSHLQKIKRRLAALGKSTDDIKIIDIEYYLQQIDDLRVVSKCKCGEQECHSVKFQNWESGETLALVNTQTEDSRMLIVFIHRVTKLLAQLEII